MATAKLITHFQNITKTGEIGSKIPGRGYLIAGHPFYLGPGQVFHDPSGTLWPLLNETGERYKVTFKDPEEQVSVQAERHVEDQHIRGDGFFGIRKVLKPLSAEAVAMHVAAGAMVPEQVLFLQTRAAKADQLEQEKAEDALKYLQLSAKMKELSEATDAEKHIATQKELQATKDQLKRVADELEQEKSRKGVRAK